MGDASPKTNGVGGYRGLYMKHALIKAATPAQMEAAEEASDWLLDAVATSTQDRRFLRGEPEYDATTGEAILINAVVACLRAMKYAQEGCRS